MNIVWTIIEPGVLGLEETSLRVTLQPNATVRPWCITWRGSAIPDGLTSTLKDAKEKAAAFARELAEVGLEP